MRLRPLLRTQPTADVCRFCGATEARAFAGTTEEMTICDACVDAARQLVARASGDRAVQPDARCSFCDAPRSEVDALVAGDHGYICRACLEDASTLVAIGFGPCDEGWCDFCGKAHREVKMLLAPSAYRYEICDECVGRFGALITGTLPAHRARTPDPEAASSTLPRWPDGFRCVFCNVHGRDVHLMRLRRTICRSCAMEALTVVQRDAEPPRIDDVLREHAEQPLSKHRLLVRILEIATPESIDDVMRALPDDLREVVVAYVQETFACDLEVEYVGDGVRSRERNDVLCDWVRRAGRFHFPRRADEPSIDEIRER